MQSSKRLVSTVDIGVEGVINFMNPHIIPSTTINLHQIKFHSHTSSKGTTYYGCKFSKFEFLNSVQDQLDQLFEKKRSELQHPNDLLGVYATCNRFLYLREDSYRLMDNELKKRSDQRTIAQTEINTSSRKVELKEIDLTTSNTKFMKLTKGSITNELAFTIFEPYVVKKTGQTYYIGYTINQDGKPDREKLKDVEKQLIELLEKKRAELVNPKVLQGVYAVADNRIILNSDTFDLIKDEVNKKMEIVNQEEVIDFDIDEIEKLIEQSNPPHLIMQPQKETVTPTLESIIVAKSVIPDPLPERITSTELGLSKQVWNAKKRLIHVDMTKYTNVSEIPFYHFKHTNIKKEQRVFYACCLYDINSMNLLIQFLKENAITYNHEGDYFLIQSEQYDRIKQHLLNEAISLESESFRSQFFPLPSETSFTIPSQSTAGESNKVKKRKDS